MELGEISVSHPTLRERHKEATRRELREAAYRLFERDGFGSTSVDDIAREAGVSRSTFFRYFRSKAALLSDSDENAALFLGMLRDRPAAEGRMRALEETLVDFAETLRSDDRREEFELIERIVASDQSLRAGRAEMISRWRQEVARVLAERGHRSEPDLEDELAAAILSQITEQLRMAWRSADDVPVVELIRRHFSSLRALILG